MLSWDGSRIIWVIQILVCGLDYWDWWSWSQVDQDVGELSWVSSRPVNLITSSFDWTRKGSLQYRDSRGRRGKKRTWSTPKTCWIIGPTWLWPNIAQPQGAWLLGQAKQRLNGRSRWVANIISSEHRQWLPVLIGAIVTHTSRHSEWEWMWAYGHSSPSSSAKSYLSVGGVSLAPS